MKLRVREVQLYERPAVLRLPFRFGVVTLREAPQLFVRARVELQDGSSGWGWAAELLAPKWFDKNPDLSNEENFEQLRESVRRAVALYPAESSFQTPFDLFASHYRPQIEVCAEIGLNSLIACFGPALLDRAVLDAACRTAEVSFYEAIRKNLPDIYGVDLICDLKDFPFENFIKNLNHRRRLHVRHTVGLVDPLEASDLREEQRIADGLPETLEEAVTAYGHRYFKVKVCGQLDEDIPRLKKIARVVERGTERYSVTLDGNEQYDSIREFNDLLEAMSSEPALKRFVASILFIEQPLSRQIAMEADLKRLKSSLPVIIDESDDSLEAFRVARRQGYRGVSTKACKGFYKSIINAARCALWNQDDPSQPYFMSAEDLTVQAGISLQQDLAIVALLGLEHVERNGHHYVNGMAAAPPAEQEAFLAAHPDLYERKLGAVRMKIESGQVRVASLDVPGFASSIDPHWDEMESL